MPISIFEIPLLQDLVCLTLAPKDIRSCTLVCHLWHDTFGPYLWQDLIVRRKWVAKRFLSDGIQAKLPSVSRYIRTITTYHAIVLTGFVQTLPETKRIKKEREKRMRKELGWTVEEVEGIERRKAEAAAALEKGKQIVSDSDGVEEVIQGMQVLQMTQGAPVATSSSSTTTPRRRIRQRQSPFQAIQHPLPQPMRAPLYNLTTLRSKALRNSSANMHANNMHLHPILALVHSSPNLHTLEISHFQFDDDVVQMFCKVIWHHPRLQDVAVGCSRYGRFYQIRSIFRHCSKLVRFALSVYPYGRTGFIHMPDTISVTHGGQAETVPGSGTRMILAMDDRFPSKEEDLSLRWMPEARLECLDVSGTSIYWNEDATLLPFLKKCPRLKELRLPNIYPGVVESLRGLLQEDLLRLEKLDCGKVSGLSDSHVAIFLRAIERRRRPKSTSSSAPGPASVSPSTLGSALEEPVGLRSFSGTKGPFIGQETITALLSLHWSLTEINLTNCSKVSGAMVQSLLVQCVNLEQFRALNIDHYLYDIRYHMDPILHVEDMLKPGKKYIPYSARRDDGSDDDDDGSEAFQTWGCLGLKVLCLQFHEQMDEIFPRPFIHQIRRLTLLEELFLQRKEFPKVLSPAIADGPMQGSVAASSSATGGGSAATGGGSATTENAATVANTGAVHVVSGANVTQHEGSPVHDSDDASEKQPKEETENADEKKTEEEPEQTPEEIAGDKNMDEVISMICTDLPRLKMLEFTNLHQYIYDEQLKTLRARIAGIEHVTLY